MDKNDAPPGENLKNNDTTNDTFHRGNTIQNDTLSNEKLNETYAFSTENLNNNEIQNDTFHSGNKIKHDTSSNEKLNEHDASSVGNLNNHDTKMTHSIMEI